MKIALVVERFEPGAGGVESVAHHLAAQLGRRREHVTVVCRQVGAPIPAGVQVECVAGPRFWQPLRISRFSVRAARATAHGFDVVHGFSRTRHQHVYRAGGGSHAAYPEGRSPRRIAGRAIRYVVGRVDRRAAKRGGTLRGAHGIDQHTGLGLETEVVEGALGRTERLIRRGCRRVDWS